MRKLTLLLGVGVGLSMSAYSAVAGGEDGDVNSYDNMGYYVYSADDPDQMQQNNFDGPYAGIDFGGNFRTVKYTDDDATSKISEKIATSNMLAGLRAGWGFTFDEFYLGLEGNFRYTFGGGASAVIDNHYADNFKQTWSVGGGMRIGGIVYNTALMYLYLGGAYSGNKLDNISGDVNQASVTANKFGFAVGPGVEVQMNRIMNVDFRYLYRSYGKTSFTDGAGTHFSVDPTDNLVLMSLVFHFGA